MIGLASAVDKQGAQADYVIGGRPGEPCAVLKTSVLVAYFRVAAEQRHLTLRGLVAQSVRADDS